MSSVTKITLALVLACVAAACSSLRFAYDNADTYLFFRANSYLDLDPKSSDELDERMDAAWTPRTSSDLAILFHDLPALQPAAPRRRPSAEARRSWRTGVRLSWVFVLLVVLAAVTEMPWFVVAFFAFMWWSGLLGGLHRWSHHRR